MKDEYKRRVSHASYTPTVAMFLDVLGTQKRKEFSEKHAIHRLFHEEMGQNGERQQSSPHVVYTRTIRTFSDCAYVLYQFKDEVEESRRNEVRLLYTALFNTSLSVLRINHAGYTVRGGVAFGDGFVDDLGFFGPAIEAAYGLERRAKNPRLVLDPDLGRRLSDWEKTVETHEIIRDMFVEMPQLILQDQDGEYFLNIFYELQKSGSVEFSDCTLTLEETRETLFQHLAVEEEKNANDEAILGKLKWMRRFVEDAVPKIKPGYAYSFTSIILGP